MSQALRFFRREICAFLEELMGYSNIICENDLAETTETVTVKIKKESKWLKKAPWLVCCCMYNIQVTKQPGDFLFSHRGYRLLATITNPQLTEWGKSIIRLMDNFICHVCYSVSYWGPYQNRNSGERAERLGTFLYIDLPDKWRSETARQIGAWWARVSYLTEGVAFEEVDGALLGD